MSELNHYFESCLFNILNASSDEKSLEYTEHAISILTDDKSKINIDIIDNNLLLRAIIKSFNTNLLSTSKKANIDFDLNNLSFNPLKELIHSYVFTLNKKMNDINDTAWEYSFHPYNLSRAINSLFFDLNMSSMTSLKEFNPLKKLSEEYCKYKHESIWDLIETFYYAGFDPSAMSDIFFEGDMEHEKDIIKKWSSEYQSGILSHELSHEQPPQKKRKKRHVL